MSRAYKRVLVTGVSIAASMAARHAMAANRPNVVVIMTDDVGWGDLGTYGGGETRGAPTPYLDRLAAEGSRFTTWYGQASCTAGRASFITGRVPIRSALSVVIGPGDPNHLHKETPTIAEFFQRNGYRTYFSGKWHLGDKPDAFPIEHGFDEMKHFAAYYAGVYAYTDTKLHPSFPANDPQFMAAYNKQVDDGEWEGTAGQPPHRVKQHITYDDLATFDDRQRDSATQYIRQHASDAKPFFMEVAFLKVHNPNNPSPAFKGRSHEGNYLDALMELDYNSGQVVQAIRDAGIAGNTIVVWTTDNGPWVDAWPDAGYTPFRGMKGSPFEGGWRVPGIMWWPGHIPAGRVLNGMMSHMDVWPTCASLVGLAPPPHGAWKGNDGKPIFFDGIDNSAYVLGRADRSARQDWVYVEGTQLLAVRHEQWKFVFTGKDTWLGPELPLGGIPAVYNLRRDPGESYDETFNGAAPPTAGVLKSSPGRYSGEDSGWTMVYANKLVTEFTQSTKEFPNIETVAASASIGSDLPQFMQPDIVSGRPSGGAGGAGGTGATMRQPQSSQPKQPDERSRTGK
jgi:arylsulfatase